jgi:hypothetical protein
MKAINGVLVLLLAALPGMAQEAAPKAHDYYPLKAGSKWSYQVDFGNGQKAAVVYQVTKIEDVNGKPQAVVEQLINGEVRATEYVGVDTGGVYKYRYNGVELSPPVCLLRFPIKSGSTWETETKTGTQQITIKAEAGGEEEVQVPAGKYKAVSVKIKTKVKTSEVNTTYWFAPDVGIIRESTSIPGGTVKMELTKFEAGK